MTRTGLILLLLLAALPAQDLALAGWFGDHMVLQQGRPAPVWGWAAPGAAVQVQLGQAAPLAVTAGADGRWRAVLPALAAGGPYRLAVSAGGAGVVADDVMVGEVFLCAGQSNMDLSFDSPYADPADRRTADEPWLRMLKLGSNPSVAPVQDLRRSGAWPPGDHRIATWRSGSAADATTRLYLDGVAVAAGLQPSAHLGIGESEFRVGLSGINARESDGALDEVRLHAVELDAAAIEILAAPGGDG